MKEQWQRALRAPEDSEDLKVGISEFGRKVCPSRKLPRNEKREKLFEIFRQGEEGAIEESCGVGKAMSRHDAGSGTFK